MKLLIKDDNLLEPDDLYLSNIRVKLLEHSLSEIIERFNVGIFTDDYNVVSLKIYPFKHDDFRFTQDEINNLPEGQKRDLKKIWKQAQKIFDNYVTDKYELTDAGILYPDGVLDKISRKKS